MAAQLPPHLPPLLVILGNSMQQARDLGLRRLRLQPLGLHNCSCCCSCVAGRAAAGAEELQQGDCLTQQLLPALDLLPCPGWVKQPQVCEVLEVPDSFLFSEGQYPACLLRSGTLPTATTVQTLLQDMPKLSNTSK